MRGTRAGTAVIGCGGVGVGLRPSGASFILFGGGCAGAGAGAGADGSSLSMAMSDIPFERAGGGAAAAGVGGCDCDGDGDTTLQLAQSVLFLSNAPLPVVCWHGSAPTVAVISLCSFLSSPLSIFLTNRTSRVSHQSNSVTLPSWTPLSTNHFLFPSGAK